MRLWSIHPKYLDTKGLLAAWREGLLALNVLQGKTIGYTHHPQLIRFKATENPISYISSFLTNIYFESKNRNYNFADNKFDFISEIEPKIKVSNEQIAYEFELLKYKLQKRDKIKLLELEKIQTIELNNVFEVYNGKIETWEKIINELI